MTRFCIPTMKAWIREEIATPEGAREFELNVQFAERVALSERYLGTRNGRQLLACAALQRRVAAAIKGSINECR